MRGLVKAWLVPVGMVVSMMLVGCNGARDTALSVGETSNGRGFVRKTLVNEGRTRQYCVFLPMNYTPTRKWPAIMFLHGVGEAGHDLQGPMRVGLAPFVADQKDDFPFIVIIPQSSGGWGADSDDATDAIAALMQAEKDYSIDPDRVSLTGLSTGGYGTFAIGAKYNHLFAALVPMCPSGADASDGDTLGRMNIWAFENAADPFVTPGSMVITLASIKNNGGTVKHTIYPMVGHDCWETAYSKGELFAWLQEQRRPGAVASGTTAVAAAMPVTPVAPATKVAAVKPAVKAARPVAAAPAAPVRATSSVMPVAPSHVAPVSVPAVSGGRSSASIPETPY